ncbi:exodeoxyribonuclease VII small subunit [Oligoflexia bacterium]|nr:exodeoxyribonuclease VII small subunit [Oligoflexia bacterium]
MAKIVTLKELVTADDTEAVVATLSFENGLKLLEELVGKVESGSLSLDNAIMSYEKGVLIIEQLRKLLSGAEEKLKVLQK